MRGLRVAHDLPNEGRALHVCPTEHLLVVLVVHLRDGAQVGHDEDEVCQHVRPVGVVLAYEVGERFHKTHL